MSANSIGPMGMPNCLASRSSTGPGTPSANKRMASSKYGIRMRLTRKPGVPLTATGSLPNALHSARARFSTA